MANDGYELQTGVVYEDGVYVTATMPVPVGTRWFGATTKGHTGECAICGYRFPLSAMTLAKGRYYCRPNGCARDLEVRK